MELYSELGRILDPQRVLTRTIDRIAFASDASVYRLVPRAVVLPRSIDEVRALFRYSAERRIPLTFRAAGTSLSGQAVTDGILVVLSRHWAGVRVLDEGRRVWVQPGIIGGVVNQHLAPHGAKIGPDPASINACMMGGILANNSSGMCCGVAQNAYHTLQSLRFVLPDGLEIDTADPAADERLRQAAPAIAAGLLRLRERILSDGALASRIRAKYRMKNTTGYSLNAFLDHDTPAQILAHLMIGSEGTLGFIAEAVLNTVPDYPLKSTGLLFFRDVPDACAAIPALRDSGARTLELMDRASLRAIARKPGVPPGIEDLPPLAAAVLLEYQCGELEELERSKAAFSELLPALPVLHEVRLTEDPHRQAALWNVRKGLIPSVGAMRRRGTSMILEDVVFPVERLDRGVGDLQELFARFGYDDAIVFGHAKDGNLHFVLIQGFGEAREVERFDHFMHEMADLVVGRYDGALKAEHGTGRNMAPFVAFEWGTEAYEIMRELKRLVDPAGLLNPGVIVNDDPRAHVAYLKRLPAVEAEADACIECGFCERMCPSRELTLTPRQRIVVRREIARLTAEEPRSPALAELTSDFGYAALDTCATDGLCALACPVGIDTGALVKRLRRERRSDAAEELAARLAERLGWIEPLARAALAVASAFDRRLPLPARASTDGARRDEARAVCFPGCVSRVIGPDRGRAGEATVAELVGRVAARAGVPVYVPRDAAGTCCGLAFGSKGYAAARQLAVNRAVERLWDWSAGAALPVIVDSSPCALALKSCRPDLSDVNRDRFDRLAILDGIEFARELLRAGLAPRRVRRSVTVHPVCSVRKMELVSPLLDVLRGCADRVDTPLSAGCCGFAGDRGFRVPELTAAATRAEAAEVCANGHDGHYSSSRTCEIALGRATGRSYESFWALLEEATRPV